MDWKNFAIDDLKRYRDLHTAKENLEQRLKVIEIKSKTVRAGNFEKVCCTGGKKLADFLMNITVEKKQLCENLVLVNSAIESVNRGLAALEPEERKILEVFYIQRPYGHVDLLCEEFGCEQAKVYKRKDAALRRFTMGQYGIV